jgi:hypothetical protein
LATGLTVGIGGSVGAAGTAPAAPAEPVGDPVAKPCADFNGGDSAYQLTYNNLGIPVALVVTASPVTLEAPSCKGAVYSMVVLGMPTGTTYDATAGPNPNQFTVPLARTSFVGDGTTGTATPIIFTAALSATGANPCPVPTAQSPGSTTVTLLSAAPCVDINAMQTFLPQAADLDSGPPFVCVFVKVTSPSQGDGDGGNLLDRAPTKGCFVTGLDPNGSPGRGYF